MSGRRFGGGPKGSPFHGRIVAPKGALIGEPKEPQGPPAGIYRYAVPALIARDGEPLDADTFIVPFGFPIESGQHLEMARLAIIGKLKAMAPEKPEPRVTINNAPYLVEFTPQEIVEKRREFAAAYKAAIEAEAEAERVAASVLAAEEKGEHLPELFEQGIAAERYALELRVKADALAVELGIKRDENQEPAPADETPSALVTP